MQKLENGTYDAYQCFQEGTSLNLPKDELDPVHFTTKVVTLKKGFPKVTGLYAMLDISIWELESEGDAIKKYEAFLTNYWTNPFENKEESRQEIMEKDIWRSKTSATALLLGRSSLLRTFLNQQREIAYGGYIVLPYNMAPC